MLIQEVRLNIMFAIVCLFGKDLFVTHRGPEGLDLQEDVDDAAVSKEGENPQEKEEDT